MLRHILHLIKASRATAHSDNELKENSILHATLEHAERGRNAAQETIRFLDKKTGILTGLSTLLSGVLFGWAKWSLDSEVGTFANLFTLAETSPCYGLLLSLLFTFNFGATFLCLLWSVWTVIARSRPSNLTERFVLLFPLYLPQDEKDACEIFARKLKGMTTREILSEYEDQLRVLGMILGKKMTAHRRAAWALLLQLLTVFLTFLFIVVVYLI